MSSTHNPSSLSSLPSSTSTSIHIPYPDTVDLKAAKGTFHKQLLKQPYYRNRGHHRVAFHGTVKVHGTNITIIFSPHLSSPQIQSRNNIISPESDDSYHSAVWIWGRMGEIRSKLKEALPGEFEEVMVAGELAGAGINPKQAATSDLERFFVVFGIRVEGVWLDRKVWENVRFDRAQRVFNIHEFKTFKVVVDFDEDRALGGGKKIQELCLEVEGECPVALQVGGVRGLGEGIVWTEERDELGSPASPLRFKSKGPTFAMVGRSAPSETSKPKAKASGWGSQNGSVSGAGTGTGTGTGTGGQNAAKPVDVAEEFVFYAVKQARLDQGLETIRASASKDLLQPVEKPDLLRERKHINTLATWIKRDVWKEELDELKRLGLEKGPGKARVEQLITKRVKGWFGNGGVGK